MPKPSSKHLRLQIEAAQSSRFPTDTIEHRIAADLIAKNRFEEHIDSDDLAAILRHVVYTLFARQKIAGMDTGIVHNIPTLEVQIEGEQAKVNFIAHIHQPIVAFLEFQYTLVNDPVSVQQRLRLKRGSLAIDKRTRRFDIKAKAALAAIDIAAMTHRQLADVGGIVAITLPPQLEQHGVEGEMSNVALQFESNQLYFCLEGDFREAHK